MTAIVTRETGRVELDMTYEAPAPAPGWARVRVTRAGICATDLELVQGYKGFHGVLGHEFCGVVEESPSAKEWAGRRVVGDINIACGECAPCRRGHPNHCARRRVLGILGHDGAFAERLLLLVANLHGVPDDVADDTAVFTEPVAAALEVAEQAHIRPSNTVYVLGDGKLGLLVAQALALTGCACLLIGRHSAKLDLARAWGVDTLSLARDSAGPDLTPADVVVDCTGRAEGLRLATSLLRPRG